MSPSWQSDFFEIDISKVRVQGLEPTWQTSKSYTRSQMNRWIEQIDVIQRLCRDKQYSVSDFQRMRQSQNPTERSLGETYHKFYDYDSTGINQNKDYIKVDWVDDHYEVVNGRHRLALAQEAGLRHLPAYVSAPDRATLERLRSDGELIARGTTPRRERSAPPTVPGATPQRPAPLTPKRF